MVSFYQEQEMNNINFIKPIPPEKQEALNRWFSRTVYSSIVLALFFMLTTVYQVINLIHLHRKQKNLNHIMHDLEPTLTQIHAQEEQKDILSRRLKKISDFKKNPKLPTSYLQELSRIIPPDVALTKYAQEKNRVSLEGKALKTDSVLTFVQRLHDSSFFEDVQLTSLHHQKNNTASLYFVLKGKIISTY